MKKNISPYFLALMIFVGFPIIAFARELPKQNIKTLRPYKAMLEPKIDAVLDEDVWKMNPILEDIFISFYPHFGEELPQKTRIWMAYDPDNLYFAFYCHDREPERIKSSISKRDNISNDDWIGFSLDAVGTKQTAYNFFINPNGIQNDAYQSGSKEDLATDWVWYSVGRLADDGYIVEVKVPLKSIRYRSGKGVEMGILFWRHINRYGMRGSWPAIPPDNWVFESSTKVIYEKLKDQLQLELLPLATYGSIRDRIGPDNFGSADTSTDIGIGVKYGITSSINAELTINPDFSQVESDVFQVVVNQRYPIFYEEKRPFFMETQSLFNVAGTWGTINMTHALHTRKIVDPAWGSKLTGEVGRASFGLLAAGDEWPGREWNGEENPYEGKAANFLIGRFKYSLSGSNYVGGIYTGRKFGNDSNRVVGADLYFRFAEKHLFRANYLQSLSYEESIKRNVRGPAYTMMYRYFDKSLELDFAVEHYDDDFRMDTAFYQRIGFIRFRGYIGPHFYPKAENLSWIKRINPFIFGYYLHDSTTGMDDIHLLAAVRSYFIKQGYFNLMYIYDRESWKGRAFNQRRIDMRIRVQLANWLLLYSRLKIGNRIFYDPLDPFLGKGISISSEVTIQPNNKLSQYFGHNYEYLNRDSNGERIFDVHVLNSRTTYQFNKYLFLRAVFRYDSYRNIFLTDFLASFTLIPGTVVYLGYGSLYERKEWHQGQWVDGPGKMLEMRRSIFFKASYLWRF